jgi:hypothetical protein
MGIEEAEMYLRFSQQHAAELYQELPGGASAHKVAAVESLLEVSRGILKRLIDEQNSARRQQHENEGRN